MVRELDGTQTENGWVKQKLGANAILAVSLATARAGADAHGDAGAAGVSGAADAAGVAGVAAAAAAGGGGGAGAGAAGAAVA